MLRHILHALIWHLVQPWRGVTRMQLQHQQNILRQCSLSMLRNLFDIWDLHREGGAQSKEEGNEKQPHLQTRGARAAESADRNENIIYCSKC